MAEHTLRRGQLAGNADTDWLKLVALVFMMIDHLGVALFGNAAEMLLEPFHLVRGSGRFHGAAGGFVVSFSRMHRDSVSALEPRAYFPTAARASFSSGSPGSAFFQFCRNCS